LTIAREEKILQLSNFLSRRSIIKKREPVAMSSQFTRISLVQHVEQAEIIHGRRHGYGLGTEDHEQARTAALVLAEFPVPAIFSSPLVHPDSLPRTGNLLFYSRPIRGTHLLLTGRRGGLADDFLVVAKGKPPAIET